MLLMNVLDVRNLVANKKGFSFELVHCTSIELHVMVLNCPVRQLSTYHVPTEVIVSIIVTILLLL